MSEINDSNLEERGKKREKGMIKLTIVIFATLISYTFIIYHCFKSDIYKLFSIDLGLLYLLRIIIYSHRHVT